jgi:hypothetical protein
VPVVAAAVRVVRLAATPAADEAAPSVLTAVLAQPCAAGKRQMRYRQE